ncbi:MAG: hypothetical protein AAFO07_28245 [Bacteroidota bacterium]
MEIIKPSRAKKYLKKDIGKVQNPSEALDRFISFFKKYKVKTELEHEEEDMLLYQYGTYDWTGKGGNYEFNLTRQFAIPNDDEFMQLSLTLFYKPEIVGEIEADNSWSTNFKDLDEWTDHVKSTIGYKKVDGIKPDKIEIELLRT